MGDKWGMTYMPIKEWKDKFDMGEMLYSHMQKLSIQRQQLS